METIWQDLRFALRQMRRSPGFMFTAVVTLGLGIGINTAVFSLLDQALLRSLPVKSPHELVVLRGTGDVWEGSTDSWGGGADAYFSYPMYADLRDRDGAFQGLIATVPANVDFVREGHAQVLPIEIVSGNYFNVLGVAASLGRVFTQRDDAEPGGNPVAVASYAFWQHDLGGNPAAVGSTVSINGHPFEIIGVVQAGFTSAAWGRTPGLFVPMSMAGVAIPEAPGRLKDRKSRWLNIIGRLPSGEQIAQAEAQSAPLWYSLRAEELKALGPRSSHFVDEFVHRSHLLVQAAPGGFSYRRATLRTPLMAVMAMAVLVLLITVVNVGSLLLVRSVGRTREFSMRFALGASNSRILIQLLVEGLLLGLAGGTMGLLLAPLATHAVVGHLANDSGQAPFTSALDYRVLAFSFAIAILSSLLFSAAPAAQLRRKTLGMALRQKSGTTSRGVLLLRRLVIATQTAISLILLAVAGMFVQTVQQLRSSDVGFPTQNLVTFATSPELAGYTSDQIPALYGRLTTSLSEIPGIQGVGVTTDPELTGSDRTANVTFQNFATLPDQPLIAEIGSVNPEYFTALKLPLLAGRGFTSADDSSHPLVAVVNETLSRRLFGSPQKALEQRFMSGASDHPIFDVEIVGVVPDVKHQDLRQAPIPSIYYPFSQTAVKSSGSELYFYLRSSLRPAELISLVRERVTSVDANLALEHMHTVDEQIDVSMQNERMVALLSTCFGLLAAIVTGIGLYGVLAFSTAQRTHEIGVRMALGSSRLHVSKLVLWELFKLTIGGLAVGLPLALVLARLLRTQFYGVALSGARSILAGVAMVFLTAAVSAIVPIRRAVSVHPVEALSTE